MRFLFVLVLLAPTAHAYRVLQCYTDYAGLHQCQNEVEVWNRDSARQTDGRRFECRQTKDDASCPARMPGDMSIVAKQIEISPSDLKLGARISHLTEGERKYFRMTEAQRDAYHAEKERKFKIEMCNYAHKIGQTVALTTGDEDVRKEPGKFREFSVHKDEYVLPLGEVQGQYSKVTILREDFATTPGWLPTSMIGPKSNFCN